ncbi:uncharacterized protein LOC111703634 [Eurytemora carolleeae]|uniref:uncharacterized protein LOC111703634 n=1 Tax=Eurytemora carolleeae TaxID=1294199 RepID=UPI000C778810|nr:uncharacterized protein LOC111703634 [Eurytemora carolleeae]|eukprot:XP_023331405.1 uncharacterized protein LOC111703634 [Eurytemora affinis]
MRASDNVRIRRQFRSYEKPQDEICVGDRVYCAALPPQGEEGRERGEVDQPNGEVREQADQHQRRGSTRVNQLLFVGMLAVLVGQASAEEIPSGITPDSIGGFSKPKFSEIEIEWSLQGGYGYFVSTTVAPTLHVLSQAMDGAGAVEALTFTCWVVRTLFRISKTGYINSRMEHG